MAKQQKESIETQVAVQETDIEYIKQSLERVENSLESLQDRFLTKAEYYERGKIIEHIENDYRKMVGETKGEISRVDGELDSIDNDLRQVKWWLKSIAWCFGVLWPIIMLVIAVWVNRYL